VHWYGAPNQIEGDGVKDGKCYIKDVPDKAPAKLPKVSHAGTVWAVILIILFLIGFGLLGKFYGK